MRRFLQIKNYNTDIEEFPSKIRIHINVKGDKKYTNLIKDSFSDFDQLTNFYECEEKNETDKFDWYIPVDIKKNSFQKYSNYDYKSLEAQIEREIACIYRTKIRNFLKILSESWMLNTDSEIKHSFALKHYNQDSKVKEKYNILKDNYGKAIKDESAEQKAIYIAKSMVDFINKHPLLSEKIDAVCAPPSYESGANKRLDKFLANFISNRLNVTDLSSYVIKKEKSKKMKEIKTLEEKKNNIKGAFKYKEGVLNFEDSNYKNILLIDDLFGSGLTLNELAKTLLGKFTNAETYSLNALVAGWFQEYSDKDIDVMIEELKSLSRTFSSSYESQINKIKDLRAKLSKMKRSQKKINGNKIEDIEEVLNEININEYSEDYGHFHSEQGVIQDAESKAEQYEMSLLLEYFTTRDSRFNDRGISFQYIVPFNNIADELCKLTRDIRDSLKKEIFDFFEYSREFKLIKHFFGCFKNKKIGSSFSGRRFSFYDYDQCSSCGENKNNYIDDISIEEKASNYKENFKYDQCSSCRNSHTYNDYELDIETKASISHKSLEELKKERKRERRKEMEKPPSFSSFPERVEREKINEINPPENWETWQDSKVLTKELRSFRDSINDSLDNQFKKPCFLLLENVGHFNKKKKIDNILLEFKSSLDNKIDGILKRKVDSDYVKEKENKREDMSF